MWLDHLASAYLAGPFGRGPFGPGPFDRFCVSNLRSNLQKMLPQTHFPDLWVSMFPGPIFQNCFQKSLFPDPTVRPWPQPHGPSLGPGPWALFFWALFFGPQVLYFWAPGPFIWARALGPLFGGVWPYYSLLSPGVAGPIAS